MLEDSGVGIRKRFNFFFLKKYFLDIDNLIFNTNINNLFNFFFYQGGCFIHIECYI